MRCTNKKIRKMIDPYFFDLLTEQDKLLFEAHLLECQVCFDEVHQFVPIVDALKKNSIEYLEVLQPKTISKNRYLSHFKDVIENYSEKLSLFGDWLEKNLVIAIIGPVTAAAMITLFFLFRPVTQISDLAIIEKASYVTFRGTESTPASDSIQIFQKGMQFYQLEDYQQAITYLAEFINLEPGDVHGQFYLGVSLLLTEKTETAISHLITATTLSQAQNNNILLERCLWHLGNAYMLTNNAKKAVAAFKKIIELKGDLATRADDRIIQINKREDE